MFICCSWRQTIVVRLDTIVIIRNGYYYLLYHLVFNKLQRTYEQLYLVITIHLLQTIFHETGLCYETWTALT